jgi:hypothetical protein
MTKTDELMERVFAIAAYDMVYSPQWDELHTAIAQALAEAPEPVAWMQVSPGETNVEFGVPRKEIPSNNSGGWDYLPLYDRPPKAEPAPELTDAEIGSLYWPSCDARSPEFAALNFARAVLKAQKEKQA